MTIQWSDWAPLHRPLNATPGKPFAQSNQDGRLEVFTLGTGGVSHTWQVAPNGGWSPNWASLDKPSSATGLTAHVVGRNADGRQEIFALSDEKAIWQKWQVAPNGDWSDWKLLGAPTGPVALTERFTVGNNQDGREELFVLQEDGRVWHIWQTAPNGGWSAWQTLEQPPAQTQLSNRITLGANEDGRQELFVIGSDGALWHIWQVAQNAGWSNWASLGKPGDAFDGSEPSKARDLSQPFVRSNADGHLEVFAPGNGAFCNRWQERWRDGPDNVVWRHQGWNAKPKPRPDVGITWLEAARNFENRLETLAFADDGALWHAWQVDTPPFWSTWQSLGTPPVKIREADRLTIGINQDGRLEVFLVGEDDALWHIWQVR